MLGSKTIVFLVNFLSRRKFLFHVLALVDHQQADPFCCTYGCTGLSFFSDDHDLLRLCALPTSGINLHKFRLSRFNTVSYLVSSFPFLNASLPASHYKYRPGSSPVHRGLPSIAPSFLHSTISVSEFIMFPKVALTSLLLLAMSVAATPVAVRDTLITLPFAKQINSTGSGTIVQQDKARIQRLVAKLNGDSEFQEDVGSVPVTNQLVSYIVSLGVGELALELTVGEVDVGLMSCLIDCRISGDEV